MLGIYILAVCVYIGIGVVFYSSCITASEADKQMEEDYSHYWRTTYYCKGSDYDGN